MSLVVYSSGERVGLLDMADGEPFYGFTYDEEYLSCPDCVPLSLSLPLRSRRFEGREALPFFEGLLPEGSMRALIARQLHVSVNSPAKLLRALGRDCAGDVAVLEEDDPFQPPATDRYEPLGDGLAHISRSPYQEIARLREGNRLSLAGGMAKIGLYHDAREGLQAGWYLPLGGSPSTHIVKPQPLQEYPLLAYNELLCMRLAYAAGLRVADVEVVEDATPLLVVRRFDREPTGGSSAGGLDLYRRLRQEDFCQALGYSSGLKYEQEGGPGIRAMGGLLLRHSDDYLRDREALVRLVTFNYLIGNCDAHAKNYSLMLGAGETVRLAPAYDLLSTTVYDGEFGAELSRGMGMAIGGHGNIDRVTLEDLDEMGRWLGLRERVLHAMVADVADCVHGSFEAVAGEIASGVRANLEPLVERLAEGIGRRAAMLAGGA